MADGSGDYTPPKGIHKNLNYNHAEEVFDLTTPDYMTYRFKKCDSVPGENEVYYYRLDYIEDRNGVRIYVDWEDVGTGYGDPEIERYRIKQIYVSSDKGNTKTTVIKFRYTSWEDSANSDAFHLIRTMQNEQGQEWQYEYDESGRLIKVKYPDGFFQEYAYTLVGSDVVDNYLLTTITDRRGTDWEVSYASSYWRIDNDSSSSTDYHTTSYAWSVDSNTYTLPTGFVASGSGYTPGVTYRTVKCVKTDAESKAWDFFHNCLHGPGNVGNLMRRDDPESNVWGYFWDDPASDETNDNLLYLTTLPLTATNADTVQRTEYTTTGNGFKLVHRTYPMRGSGGTEGVKGTVEDAQYVQYTYTTNESTVAKIEHHKDYTNSYFFSETNHTYDAYHRLIKTVTAINPDPSPGSGRDEESLELTTYMEYNGFGNLIRSTDARGNSSSYYYNQWGALIRSANPLGGVSKQSYDELNIRLISSTDANGNTTYYSYDPLGQLVATRDAQGNVSKTQYDKNGNVIGRADPRGHSGQLIFDKKNRLIKTVSPSGVVRELTFSKTNQVLLEKVTYWDEDYSTNEQVVYRRTFYNDAGRVISRSLPSDTDYGTDPDDWETANKLAAKYTFDANGNTLTVTDRYGQITTNTYDWANRLETTQPPNIPDTTAGEVIRTTYKTIYSGPMARVSEEQIKEEHSTGGQTGWATDRDFYFVKIYTNDRAGRTIIVQIPDHTMLGTTYSAYQDRYYDANGNVTQSQLRQVHNGTTDTFPTYKEYDLANRVVKESKLVSDDTDTYDRVETTYEYSPAGQQVAVNRGGLVIQRTFDSANRVTSVTKSSCSSCGGGRASASEIPVAASQAAASTGITYRFDYDASGNRVTYSDPAGVFASVTHDAENRPVAVTDRAGRVTTRAYWPTGQLKKETRPDGSFTGYEYDIEGRATKIWASVPEPNAAQAAGPFGLSEQCALIKTIEYYRGCAMPSGSGQNLAWSGTTINSGAYVSGVRTYTYKGAGPVYYDMVYTSNARGQSEKTCFIDADDSTTRETTRYYTWRDRMRRITHPDTNYIDYTYDDHMRMTAEKLDGDTEKYEYYYCLCGAVKRQRYTYEDSLTNSQQMDWTWTTDKLGRITKEYYPYEIAKDGDDKYHSLLWKYDRAGRRELYSDPTYGHVATDTTGWTNHTEPADETDWVFGEPERYLYGETGGLSAMGRVAGAEVRAGDGEPYFVKRDLSGRVASVIYPNKSDTEKPEYELRYTYTNDGQLAQVAMVQMENADESKYGPEVYVVQYKYDNAGRVVGKVVRDNAVQDWISTRYEAEYGYDGMGHLVKERILKYNQATGRMEILQDTRTTYDLGGNPTEIQFYDEHGWAYTETRSYAKGYQLTDFAISNRTTGGYPVTPVVQADQYTYDANNNMTGTRKLDIYVGAEANKRLHSRPQWTFTFDRKNRLKSHTNSNASYVRGNLWYDGQGRVWQRWNDNTNTSEWDPTLKRLVYDGGAMVQEHEFDIQELVGQWVYTYSDITRDYLRHPAGVRQRERTAGNDKDYYMQANQGVLEYKTERNPVSASIAREFRNSSLDQMPSTTFANTSNLATSGAYIESYGGGTSGTTAGFDGLVQRGGRHYLAGVGRYLSRMGNNAYTPGGEFGGSTAGTTAGFDRLVQRSGGHYLTGLDMFMRSMGIFTFGGGKSGGGGASGGWDPILPNPEPELPIGPEEPGDDDDNSGGSGGISPGWGHVHPPGAEPNLPPPLFPIEPPFGSDCDFDCGNQILIVDFAAFQSHCCPEVIGGCSCPPESIHYITSFDPDLCCYPNLIAAIGENAGAWCESLPAIAVEIPPLAALIEVLTNLARDCCECILGELSLTLQGQCEHGVYPC